MIGIAYHAQMPGFAGAFTARGIKRFRHPILGQIALECSLFAVDGRPDLGIILYNLVTRSDADRIGSLVPSLPVQPWFAASSSANPFPR
jgi:hypothetical protein